MQNVAKIWGLLIILCLSSTSHAQTGPSLLFSDGYDIVTELTIGDDLFVVLDSATANSTYTVSLSDVTGTPIASITVSTDVTGGSDPVPLWKRRDMIVGCDPGASPNPSAYSYTWDSEANTALDGSSFLVDVKDPAGMTVLSHVLSAVADTVTPRTYASDSLGCPRYVFFDTETAYGTVINLNQPTTLTPSSLVLWLVDQVDPNGDPISDARQSYPNGQTFAVPSRVSTHTEPVAMLIDDLDADICIPLEIHPPITGTGTGSGGGTGSPWESKISSQMIKITCSATSNGNSCPPCDL